MVDRNDEASVPQRGLFLPHAFLDHMLSSPLLWWIWNVGTDSPDGHGLLISRPFLNMLSRIQFNEIITLWNESKQ